MILRNKFWYFSLFLGSKIAIYLTSVQSATLSPEGDRATLEGDNDILETCNTQNNLSYDCYTKLPIGPS